MKAVQAKYDAQLKEVLNPQQYAQFIDWKPSRSGNGANKQRVKTAQ
jgi:Spy/CpxP family protein refolding chaperone